ncbi:MAG: hypothetical protein ABF714_14065, partial [Novacetimonas hansenii]|uniref:hypothetical protein n=1 Tax=Novacetimonas hansenii TaxID=436 RepID=UPI0039E83B69
IQEPSISTQGIKLAINNSGRIYTYIKNNAPDNNIPLLFVCMKPDGMFSSCPVTVILSRTSHNIHDCVDISIQDTTQYRPGKCVK